MLQKWSEMAQHLSHPNAVHHAAAQHGSEVVPPDHLCRSCGSACASWSTSENRTQHKSGPKVLLFRKGESGEAEYGVGVGRLQWKEE